jgi:RimJ/RimL family protein N-acetyltransferase
VVIETTCLTLVPTTVALARSEITDRGEFARLLGASVPDNWPPETLADALPVFLGWLEAAPERVGWFAWYALAAGEGSAGPVLIGSGGFKGPPQDGTAEIGYSVLPRSRGGGMRPSWSAAWFGGRGSSRAWPVWWPRPSGPTPLRCAC